MLQSLSLSPEALLVCGCCVRELMEAGGGSGPPAPGGREFSSLATRDEPFRTLFRLVLAGLVLVLGGVGEEAGGCLSLQLILELSRGSGDDGRVSGSLLLIVLSKSSYVLKLRMAKPSMTSSSKMGSLFLFLRFGGLGGFDERPGDSSPSSAL